MHRRYSKVPRPQFRSSDPYLQAVFSPVPASPAGRARRRGGQTAEPAPYRGDVAAQDAGDFRVGVPGLLQAADGVVVPIQCEYYALEGLGQLMRNVELIRSHLNPRLHVSTILLTMYDARTRLAAQVAEEVRTHFGPMVLRTTVPRSVRISEAPSYGEPICYYDKANRGALAYQRVAEELLERNRK